MPDNDLNANTPEFWRAKNSYYYDWLAKIYASNVRPGSRVLHVGCGCGDLLASVKPSYGIGIDTDPQRIVIARQKYPHLRFEAQNPHWLKLEEKFDYVLICNSIGVWNDIQKVFEMLRPCTHEDTRLLITYYSYLWEGLLRLGSRLGLRQPNSYQNWLPPEDIINLLYLSEYESIRNESYMMIDRKSVV